MNLDPAVLAAVAMGASIWVEGETVRFAVPPEVDAPSIDDLVAHGPEIREALGGDGGACYPLTQGQLVLRHICRLSHGAHNVAAAVRIRAEVDPQRLGEALATCGERHPALRTSIVTTEEGPIRRVAPRWTGMLGSVDAAGWSEPAFRAALIEAQRAPFDLETRLIRVLLYTVSPGEHTLLVVAHHLIADDDSLHDLVTDLELACAGLDLPAVPASPLHAVTAERAALSGDEGARLRAYWKTRLSGDPAALDLPLDHARKRERRSGAARHRFRIAPGTAALVRAFADGTVAVSDRILLSAFEATLIRHTGQNELVVSTLLSGRADAAAERIDNFLRPVPLRIGFGDEPPTFRSVLRATDEALDGARAHAILPLDVLVDERPGGGEADVAAMFRTCFSMRTPLARGGSVWQIETIVLEPLAGPYDLSLELAPDGDAFAGALTYRPDLFDARTVARFAERFERLLDGAVRMPDHPISSLPLLGDIDREQLAHWNTGGRKAAIFTHPLEAFQALAATDPTAPALVCGDRVVSYADLNVAANRLARELSERGASAGTRVAVCLERGLDLIVTLLAVMKCGAAYVPLDPAYPEARLRFMLGDAEPALIVTHSSVEPLAAAGHVLTLDAAAADIARHSAEDLGGGVVPGGPAYLLFTSGSTGLPKGVVATHGNLASFVGWATQAFPREAFAGVFAATSVCFDLSVFEIFAPLAVGGCVILAESAFQLPLLPGRDEVTMINTVPSVMAELLRLGPLPPSVRVVNLAGEALSRELPHAIAAASDRHDLAIYNLYGPTEATVYATFARVDLHDERRPSIGRAIAGATTYVLDDARGLVPPGVVGELFIGGPGVTLEYWRRPELTAERYLDDPFASEPGSRMFRTGDRVRYRADGRLEFLGRGDDQVKIRGFRVELGEIESALRTHPGIAEAVVVARRNRSGDRLVAYLVMREGAAEADNATLRRHLATTLPDYMRPSQFVRLPALPRTVSGKIDRPALPEPVPRAAKTLPLRSDREAGSNHVGISR